MLSLLERFFPAELRENLTSFGLLWVRVWIGGLMLGGHGWGKLMTYGEKSTSFPDPLGIGSPMSLGLAILAEVFCSAAVVLGLLTRLAVLPLIATMLVAILFIHWEDPWQKKEFAMLYLVPFTLLLLTGPGKFSIDRLLFGNQAKKIPEIQEEG